MRLTADWASSNGAERFLNLVLRPFGLDSFVELHKVGSWQLGFDGPDEDHTGWDIWMGPVHILIERV
ncbi:hypothetical protein [Devosia beringensis]|uniref:hypothetical protein n=1 Tax=Devosia beringensis TaxID=2657486 RepID=UPI00186B5B22|nr:hypothetical protein [Devosia beringensis]